VVERTRCLSGDSSRSRPRTETLAGLHVMCPLLPSDFNQAWNALTANFVKTSQYQIS
jgi:hypothetical protein